MDDSEEIKKMPAERVRWQDEEAARPPRGETLRRSMSSMSITSIRTRREVDPTVTLPIHYRTV